MLKPDLLAQLHYIDVESAWDGAGRRLRHVDVGKSSKEGYLGHGHKRYRCHQP